MQKLVNDARRHRLVTAVNAPGMCRSQRLLIAVLNPAIIYLEMIRSDYDKCGIKALFIRGIIG